MGQRMTSLGLATATADWTLSPNTQDNSATDFTLFGREERPAYRAVVEKLQEYTKLRDNWDSYGGLAPTKQALLAAQELMNNILEPETPVPYVFPVPNGSIQIEWALPDFEVEVEVSDYDHSLLFYNNYATGEAEEVQLTTNLRPLVKVLDELRERIKGLPVFKVIR